MLSYFLAIARYFIHGGLAMKKIGCHYNIRFLDYFPNLALSSSITLSSNFLNNGPGSLSF
jgi:hypothetical protein